MLLKVAPSIGVSTPPSSAVRHQAGKLSVGFLRPFEGRLGPTAGAFDDSGCSRAPGALEPAHTQATMKSWTRRRLLAGSGHAGTCGISRELTTTRDGNVTTTSIRGRTAQAWEAVSPQSV